MADTTAGDVRSVVRNATMGLRKGVAGKGDTIATKEEIDTKRGDTEIQTKVKSTPTDSVFESVKKVGTPAVETPKVETPKPELPAQNMSTQYQSVGPATMNFANESTNPNDINQGGTRIRDVEINNQRPKPALRKADLSGEIPAGTVNSRIPEAQAEAKSQSQLDLGRGIRDLYTTAYSMYQNGQYLSLDFVRQNFPEFDGISDEDLFNLASDATYLATQGDYSLQNAFYLLDLYGIDANLLFDDLDPNTKAAYLTMLSKGTQAKQNPGWIDRIVNFGVGQGFSMDDGDVSLGEFLNNYTENANQSKIGRREMIGQDLVDLKNTLQKYRDYYDENEYLNKMWDLTEKYTNKEISMSEYDKEIRKLGGGGDWLAEINKGVTWKDEEKKKEFQKEYDEWAKQDTKNRLKNAGRNALINLTELAVAAYNMVNHPIDTAGMIGGLGIGVVGNLGANTGIWSDEDWDKAMNSNVMNKIEDSGAIGQWFAGIMKSSKDTASYMWNDYVIPTYGSADNFMDALAERPVDVWSDWCTAMEMGAKLSGKIKGTPMNEKIQVGVDKKGNPIMKTKGWVIGEQYAKLDPMVWFGGATTKFGEVVLGTPLKVVGAAGKGVTNLIDSFVSKTTGLNEEQRAFIRENPDLVSQFISGEKTADDIANAMREKYGEERTKKMLEGDIFNFLENSDQRLDTRGMFYKLDDVFSELGAKVNKITGEIEFTKPLEESVKQRIKKAYEYINSIANGDASVKDVHWAREGIGGLTKWDATHTLTPQEARLNSAMKDVYATVGDVLKEQVKGWAEADKAYHQILNVLQDFREWFDKDGNLKDSAYTKISNYTNKNNKQKLERLLKYFPEFDKDLKALAVSKAIEKATNATAGQYLTALSSGVGGAALFGLFGGHVGLGKIASVLLASTYLTPKNFVKVLRAEGNFRKRFGPSGEKILRKLNAGKKLTEKEADILYDYVKNNKEALAKVEKMLEKQGKVPQKKKLLADLQQQKKDLKQQLKEGKITQSEYDDLVNEIDYDISLVKSRAAKGDIEYELKPGESKAVGEKYGTKAEQKLGFIKKLEQDMTEESKKAGTTVRGYADLKKKIYNLAKNPTSTTAQHEFYHAVMSVVDEKTKRYVLDEAKRIMKEYGITDKSAEERLAESFGIYAKRGDINLGILEKRKGIQGLKDKIGDLFQRVYEWIQNYNGDRKTINKMFNEILKDEWTLDANGKLDLSYILNEAKPGGLKNKLGLESKATKQSLKKSAGINFKPSDLLEGGVKTKTTPRKPVNGGGFAFKKDVSPRYKADINGKTVDIDTKATSPDQLIEKNADGLSVMKSFISEKQAEKALGVNKELLTKDGDAYLWTHTNKYDATPFTAFENTKDSKYKEFTDNEIAWFTNSERMSRSYASDETTLAKTKAPRTDAEFKKYLDSLGTKDEGKSYTTEVEFSVKKGDDGYYVERLDKWDNTYDDEGFRDYAAFYGGMTRGAYDVLEKAVGGIDGMMDAFKQKMENNKYQNVVVERKNGKIHVHTELPSKDTFEYKDKQGLYAGMYAELQGYNKYHYQGIIQDMKNPLVVDLGKYAKGEIRFGEKVEGQGRFWSDLGTAYDFLKKNTDVDIDAVAKTIKEEFKKAVDNEDKIYDGKLMDAFQKERLPKVMEWKRLEKEGNYVEARKRQDEAGLISSAEHKISNLKNGIVDKLTPEEAQVKIGDTTAGDIYKKSKKAYDKYHDIYDMWGEANKTYQQDYPIGGGVFGDKYKNLIKKNFINYMKKKGFDEGAISMIMHDTQLRFADAGWLASYDIAEMLKNKKLQTNDYVFYALRKGGYDGVIFKDIVDYGHLSANTDGGDVVAAFNSKQFKAWDNANPTDSKYISYKKDTGLKAKNGYRIDEDAKTPRKLIKDVNGLSEMTSFVSEKQAKMAHDVSKELLSKDGNPYLRTHTNKYDAKQFANFENTLDSKYKQYTDNEIGWFTNSKAMSDSYAEGKAKAAQTKPFKNIEELNNYAKKNPITKEFSSAGNVKNETKFEYHLEKMKANDGSDWWGLYSTKTTKKTFPSLEQMWNTYKEDWMGSSLGDMPKDSAEAIKILKEKRLGGSEIKELGSGKFEVISKGDKEYVEGYDNKTQALAEGYAWMTPAKPYQYQGIITNMKKPYVVDFRDWGERGRQWNDLGTLKDFALAEGGDKIANAIKSIDNYESAKYDLIDILENSKRALLDENGRYKEGNMIEDKDYFLTNIIRNIREGTVDTLLSDGAWKGDEFASIKNDKLGDNIYPHLTYGDLYEMLQPLKDNTGLGFMDDYGTLPEVLDKMGVKGNAYNLITKMLVENEYFKGAADYFKGGETPYAGNIRINGIRDLIKKLNGIKLETNDFVKYALDDGGYDGVLFKNIRDYGGTPKEGWGQEKPADVAAVFHSRQFKAWDNANPTESKYISYKKDTGLKAKDAEYEKAVREGDTEKALGMLRKAAAEKGYKAPEDYKGAGAWSAPSADVDRKDFRNLEAIRERVEQGYDTNVFALAQGVSSQPSDYFSFQGPRWYGYDDKTGMQSYYAIKQAMDSIQKQIEMYGEVRRMPEIQVYRAVPKTLKEGMLQSGGEWVSPSIDYVKEHGMNRFDGEYKILKEKVPADELWWDGNDMREWGFDDGKEYVTKGVKNSRKNIEITYDRKITMPKYENGVKVKDLEVGEEKLIPLSKRFNEKTPDVRYKRAYHGSQADFEKFDSSHMGEGEGWQAHGWGHYFATDADVSRKYYAERGALRYKDKQIGGYDNLISEIEDLPVDKQNMIQHIASDVQKRGKTVEEAKRDLVNSYKESINNLKGFVNEAKLNLENLKKSGKTSRVDYEGLIKKGEAEMSRKKDLLKVVEGLDEKDFSKRHLYEVDIPDPIKKDTPTGSNYLEEDGELTKSQYMKIINEAKRQGLLDTSHLDYYIDYAKVGHGDKMTGWSLYRALEEMMHSDKKASKFLESMGYDGIHYNGGRDGEAYVIFSDDAPQIQNHIRYKKGLQKKESGLMNDIDNITKDWIAYEKKVTEFPTFEKEYKDLAEGKKTLYRGETYGNDKQRFWTDDEDIAESFGDIGVSKEKVVIKKPLDMRIPGIKKLIKEQIKDIDIDKAIDAYKPDFKEKEKLMNWAAKQGFDAIIGETTDNGMNYRGTEYIMIGENKNNPNIRYKLDAKGVTTEPKLLIEDLKEIKEKGYGFYKGADWKIGTDRMAKIRKYIDKELGIRVHDYIRLDRSMIDWIMDKHGYDTELGYGKSLSLADWEKMPDIIENYDTIVSTSSDKGHPRYKLEKKIGNDTYHLILELNEKRGQLLPITYYVNDGGLQKNYFKDAHKGLDHKNREKAVKQFGKKY